MTESSALYIATRAAQAQIVGVTRATTTRTTGKAPLSAYVLAVVTSLVLASIVGAVASVFYDENRLLGFVIFAACTAGTFFALGWVVFVSKYTVEPGVSLDEALKLSVEDEMTLRQYFASD